MRGKACYIVELLNIVFWKIWFLHDFYFQLPLTFLTMPWQPGSGTYKDCPIASITWYFHQSEKHPSSQHNISDGHTSGPKNLGPIKNWKGCIARIPGHIDFFASFGKIWFSFWNLGLVHCLPNFPLNWRNMQNPP